MAAPGQVDGWVGLDVGRQEHAPMSLMMAGSGARILAEIGDGSAFASGSKLTTCQPCHGARKAQHRELADAA